MKRPSTLFVRAASKRGGLSVQGLETLQRLTKAYGTRAAALEAVERYGSASVALTVAQALASAPKA